MTSTRILSFLLLLIPFSNIELSVVAAESEERISDRLVEELVECELENHYQLQEHRLEVSVSGGVVSLTGEVATFADRQLAARICRRIEGVNQVRNSIKVTPETVRDELIEKEIEKLLKGDLLVEVQCLRVRSHQGSVSLSGKVESRASVRRALMLARHVRGVAHVNEEFQMLRQAGPVSVEFDREIEMRVAQLGNKFPNWHLVVGCENGEVKLAGKIQSARHKVLLTQAISMLPSVAQVDASELTLDPNLATEAGEELELLQRMLDTILDDVNEGVRVDVTQTGIRLSGTVNSLARRHALQCMSKRFMHQQFVDNQIAIKPSSQEDLAMDRELEKMLGEDKLLSELSIEVQVVDKKAVLRGEVENFNSKARVHRLVASLPGLVEIQNLLRVAWSPHYADDGIRRSVAKRLLDAQLPSSILVEVEDGKVALKGVSTAEQAEKAFAIAQTTDCIRSVDASALRAKLPEYAGISR